MSISWVHLDDDQIESIKADFVATSQQVHIAFNRALKKTMRAMRAKGARDLRLKLKIPSKIWKGRLRLYVQPREGINRLWFGLDPISLSRLSPRQTKTGVSARPGIKRKGAFIRKGKNGSEIVFKRRGQSRLPLEKQEFEIEESTLIYIEDEIFDKVEPLLYKNFNRELAWETHIDNPKNRK